MNLLHKSRTMFGFIIAFNKHISGFSVICVTLDETSKLCYSMYLRISEWKFQLSSSADYIYMQHCFAHASLISQPLWTFLARILTPTLVCMKCRRRICQECRVQLSLLFYIQYWMSVVQIDIFHHFFFLQESSNPLTHLFLLCNTVHLCLHFKTVSINKYRAPCTDLINELYF